MKYLKKPKHLIPDWMVGVLMFAGMVGVAMAGGIIYCFYAAGTALLSLVP